jgi:hypothetical protein
MRPSLHESGLWRFVDFVAKQGSIKQRACVKCYWFTFRRTCSLPVSNEKTDVTLLVPSSHPVGAYCRRLLERALRARADRNLYKALRRNKAA